MGTGKKPTIYSKKHKVEHSFFSTKLECAQSLCKKFREPAPSELHEYRQVDPILNFLRVRCESWDEAPGDPQIFSTIGAVEQDVGVTPPGGHPEVRNIHTFG